MSMFPDTPTALLTRIASEASGMDNEVWYEFFELYTPAMRNYLLYYGAKTSEVDDIVQDVLSKLVKVLREQTYDGERSRFRTYLSHMLYNQLVDYRRLAMVQREHLRVDLSDCGVAESPTAGIALDIEWREMCHDAAVEHVLSKTALSEQTKKIFRILDSEDITCEVAAKRFGVAPASVRKIKSRVGRMVAAMEKRMGEHQ